MKGPDFRKSTIEILAKRAGSCCSNPDCGRPTSGPHSDGKNSVNIGAAAHIRGARPRAKRYDENMTDVQRRSIDNGIWLCRTCAKLIDSDESKYSVSVLHMWRRQHEEEIASKLGSSNWLYDSRKREIKDFEQENEIIQRIILDRPKFWRYFLTLELLNLHLDPIQKEYSNLKRGTVYRPTKILSEYEFSAWVRQKMDDLISLIDLLKVATTEDMVLSWGSDEPLEIKQAASKIIEGCEQLLEWEIDLHFHRFPDELETIKKLMQGWTAIYLQEIAKIPEEIKRIFSRKNPKGKFVINLVFKPPVNVEEVRERISMLSKQ